MLPLMVFIGVIGSVLPTFLCMLKRRCSKLLLLFVILKIIETLVFIMKKSIFLLTDI